ncbi:MAG: cbb3-type cytochrome oxidase assembly protein CcoS [Bdellovibrionales bacterium]|jgi:cbb3-type cytochrome oxidase maturation protein|nr:cbb3-type cytochrome oxidase assembly protein CcoS [Bdellovibrionales bacterium]
MNIVELLLPLSLLLGLGFAVAFIFAVKTGQYEDCETPAHRMLFDPAPAADSNRKSKNTDIQNSLETETKTTTRPAHSPVDARADVEKQNES